MTLPVDADATPPAVHFELHTRKLGEDDACLQWLRRRYSHAAADADLLLARIENDLSACATHRWAQFSRRSPVYEATPPRTDNPQSNTTAVRMEEGKATGRHGDVTVSVQDARPRPASGLQEEEQMRLEPSRHIFTEAARKRAQTQLSKAVAAAGRPSETTSAPRPFFGGYFLPPHSAGPTSFLVFPQWMHDARVGAARPQELPYFLRGTIGRSPSRMGDDNTARIEGSRGPLQELLTSIICNASFSRKFAATTPRWPLFDGVDAVRVDVYANNATAERLSTPLADAQPERKAKPRTLNFCDSGARASFFFQNPRYSLTLGTSYRVAQLPSQASAKGPAIASLVLLDGYDSAVQRFTAPRLHRWFPSATYHLQWSAGPGVEYASAGKPWTVFGKLNTEWWVEWPLFKRVLVCIRNQSALVRPLPLQRSKEVAVVSDGSHTAAASPHGSGGETHSLFWATQGPRWDANLVRGFKDDYAAMHYASRWYTLVSAELASSTRRRERGSKGWKAPTWMLYANACFVDSLTAPPRASVGFAFSGTPRGTTDAFNVLTPFSFDCSFNWRLDFSQGRPALVSGVAPGQRAESSVLRLSHVETFRHFRCGLTWRA
ncbi:uncharacterized protein Tco025E_04432 [Trypanosoma conorhini]|uniref:Uncharacterized protein n=1 Tax=Trypanosoma conorhini TaxID=83891 RepID=A0A422PLF6_9TRYP|nr:uncharacterized protein Tco025E_04432 [Trypanosoma conorhini]RNF18535.1 hypothetical protein Tco025E_04432 [Trypanosoma conorhini]